FRSIETEIDNELENELEYDDLNNYESDDDEPKIVDLLANGKDVDITDKNIKLLNIIENECPNEFLMRRAYFQSLSKNKQDIYLMAQILAFDGGFITTSRSNKKHNRQNMITFWRYNNNILLCKKVYKHMHGISETRIKNIKRHLKDNGLSIRHHGNEGFQDFINNYAEVHGLPSPGRHLCQDTHQTIYLPTQSTFCHLWNIYTPEVQIMLPRSDLCEVCQCLKFEISHNYGDTGVKINEYLAHINLA
ncbi:10181_t:CDS:2, partial [Racocetra persica]